VLTFPALGHILGMSDAGFGLWAGTAINDTSSVVAAGYSYSVAAGDAATIVKLTRATLIIPGVSGAGLGCGVAREKAGRARLQPCSHLPLVHLVVSGGFGAALHGADPGSPQQQPAPAAQFLIVVALTAIGLSSDLRRMATAGARPVLLGLGVWLSVAGSSLVVQMLMGNW